MDYEYRGLMASTWDYLRGDPSGRDDRDFYWQIIQQVGQPVLEVGCGTGRLLLDYLAAGIDIDGVDISPEMLTLCREKGAQLGLTPTVHEQALETLALPRRYHLIIASSSVLQLIPNPVGVQQAMVRLVDHLLPEGVLVAPFMTLWREGMPLQREWENAQMREHDGALLQRMGRVWYEPETACEHTEDLYQVIVDGEVIAVEHHRRSPANRSYTQADAHRLFAGAGLVDIRVWRGFTEEDVTADDLLFTLIGIRQ